MTKTRTNLLPILSLLPLIGCTGAPIINTTSYEAGYMPGSPPPVVPVIVRGEPFSTPTPDLSAKVAGAMQGATFGPVSFMPELPGAPRTVDRVVVLFNPPRNAADQLLCASLANLTPRPPAPPGSRIPLSAALCRGDVALTAADGMLGAAAGPQDLAFRNGLAQFSLALFPGYNPNFQFDHD
ncbi:MAG TPA: hypothetical protein VGD08_11090 [Stellaceae bacterium]